MQRPVPNACHLGISKTDVAFCLSGRTHVHAFKFRLVTRPPIGVACVIYLSVWVFFASSIESCKDFSGQVC